MSSTTGTVSWRMRSCQRFLVRSFLLAFAYIGHAVWVFEGHFSALAAGCRDADLLLVDGGLVPFLQPDWIKVVSPVMRNPEIYVHDRATYALKKVTAADTPTSGS